MSDNEVMDLIDRGHNPMAAVLSGRNRNLQIVRAMWTSGNTKVSTCFFFFVCVCVCVCVCLFVL